MPIAGTEKLYPADSTIIAISQGPKDRIVSTTTGLAVNENGLLVTNTYGETTRPGIFASGDVVRGAKTVVEAVSYSKKVADAMDAYIEAFPKKRQKKNGEKQSESQYLLKTHLNANESKNQVAEISLERFPIGDSHPRPE